MWVGEALADGKEAYCSCICKARSLQWESAPLSYIMCDPVFPGFSALRNDGVTGAEIAHIFWLLSSFTHTDFCPCKRSLCRDFSWQVHCVLAFVLLRSSHSVCDDFFLLLWPHCHYLWFKKLLRVLWCWCPWITTHWVCVLIFTKFPTLKFPESWVVVSPQFWDRIYYLSSKTILLHFTLKCLMEPEPSVSLFISSLDCSRDHAPVSCIIPTSLSLSQVIQVSCFHHYPQPVLFCKGLMWKHCFIVSRGLAHQFTLSDMSEIQSR